MTGKTTPSCRNPSFRGSDRTSKSCFVYVPTPSYCQRVNPEVQPFTKSLLRPAPHKNNAFPSKTTSLSSQVHPAATRNHGRLECMGDKAKGRLLGSIAGRKVEKATVRTLIIRGRKLIRRQGNGPSRSQEGGFGCKPCGLAICTHIGCWKKHTKAIPYGSWVPRHFTQLGTDDGITRQRGSVQTKVLQSRQSSQDGLKF